MLLRCLLATTACLGAACTASDTSNATLADLPGLRVSGYLEPVYNSDPVEHELRLWLEYDVTTFLARHDGECATLDESLVVTWRGTAVFVDHGAPRVGEDQPCYAPGIFARLPSDRLGDLRVSDDSGEVVASFGPVDAARNAVLAPGQPGSFRAGDRIVVELPVDPRDQWEGQLGVGLTQAEGSGRGWAQGYRHVDGRVELTLPRPLPFVGATVLDLGAGPGPAEVTRCIGAEACELRLPSTYQLAVTLAP